MGGNYSIFKSNDEINKEGIIELFNNMDSIAADYITSESFTDMHNLLEDQYCSKLVVLTTDILSTKLKPYEISYLDKRVKMGTPATNKMIKEDVAHFNKNTVEELDVKDSEKKKDMCKGIAKFYIKLAHVYGAIITSMNPVYEYKDTDGTNKQITLANREKLSDDIISKVSKISNFCNQRILSLSSEIIKTKEDQFKKIKPDICSLNKKEVPDETGNTMTAIETSGFKELEKLYMDHYEDGIYTKSPESSIKYAKDVKKLDIAINGPKGSDPPATSFSTIKLNPYHNTEECLSTNGLPEVKLDDTTSAFKEYGDLIRKMIKTSEETQTSLLIELKKMFSFEKVDGVVKAKLREDLNSYNLDKISKTCRDIIINMYIDCEQDFIKGLDIYQAIVEDLKYDLLSKEEGLPDEQKLDIKDIIRDSESLSQVDDDGKENYSKSSNEELKRLIVEEDEQFNSLFENALKYDNPELIKLKQEIKDMIDQDKPDTELENKFNSLKKLMYEKDNEKSKKMDSTQIENDDQISTLPFEGAPGQSEITQSPELRKRDIDSLITILKGFQKIYPLMIEIKNKKNPQ
jgi:hypothetical protein